MSNTDGSAPRIAIATTSGSSGKTTTAVTIAAILAEHGLRSLLVDTDWQMDASRWAGIDEFELGDRPTLLDVLRDRRQIHQAITTSTLDGVDLLPASPLLEQARILLAGEHNIEARLRRALDDVDGYDAIIIDCRAGTELPTISGLVAADHVIAATWAGLKELRNTLTLQERITRLGDDYEKPIRLAGILPCNVQASGGAYRDALDLYHEELGDLILPPVRHSVMVTEAHAQRLPLTAKRRWRAVADDYRTVVDTLTYRGILPARRTRATA